MKRRGSRKFRAFALKFLFACTLIFAIGTIALQSINHEVYHHIQEEESQIKSLEAEIDGLTMQKNEMTTFARISDAAKKNGYTYHSVSTAAIIEVTPK